MQKVVDLVILVHTDHAQTRKLTKNGLASTGLNSMIRKNVGKTSNLLKIQVEKGRGGRKDLGNTKQVILKGSEI